VWSARALRDSPTAGEPGVLEVDNTCGNPIAVAGPRQGDQPIRDKAKVIIEMVLGTFRGGQIGICKCGVSVVELHLGEAGWGIFRVV
jgi:hypothetical protein